MRSRLIITLVSCFLATTCQSYVVDGIRLNEPELLFFSQNNLKNSGVLAQNLEGKAFLKISKSYNAKVLSKLNKIGFMPLDTKIPVLNEAEAKKIGKIPEVGETINFIPLEFYTEVIDDKELLMLAIDSPYLREIRNKYGLSDTIQKGAFRLAIGERKIIEHEDELVSSKP